MYFVDGVCTPSNELEIEYLESSLESDVIYANIMNIHNVFVECAVYQEDGDKQWEGVLVKLKNALLKLLDKIDSIVRGFIDGVKEAHSKNRIDIEAWLQSNDVQLQLSKDIVEMEREIDKQYRQLRPVIQYISQKTGRNDEAVERTCDAICENIHRNRDKYGAMAEGAVKGSIALGMAKRSKKRCIEAGYWSRKTRKELKKMDMSDPMTNPYLRNPYKKMNLKEKGISDAEKMQRWANNANRKTFNAEKAAGRRIRLNAKCAKASADIADASSFIYRSIERETKRAMKARSAAARADRKAAKAQAREMRRAAKNALDM